MNLDARRKGRASGGEDSRTGGRRFAAWKAHEVAARVNRMQSNLAARAGHWSAHHRKRAILGWIAFVIAATVLGGAVGQRMLADEDVGNGESKRADQAIADAGFQKETGEQVLVQTK